MNHYDIFDLYPYFLLYLCFILLNIPLTRTNSASKARTRIAFFIILLFEILRFGVGWDYQNYVDIVNDNIIHIQDSRYEPLSKLIFIGTIKLNFYPFIFICFGLIHLCLINFIINKFSIDKTMSWTLYLLFPLFYLQDLSTIRQAAALSCLFCSFYFLYNKKYIKYIFLVLIATGFHSSAWYGFIMLIIYKLNLSCKQNWILFIASFFLGSAMLFVIPQLNIPRLNMYISSDEKATTSLLNLLYYAINIFVLLHYKKLIKINPNNKKFIQLTNWGLVTFNLFIFEPVTSTRLSVYFLIFWILLIPSFTYIYKYKLTIISCFITLNIIYLMIYVNAYNNRIISKVSFIPYDFWWNHLPN